MGSVPIAAATDPERDVRQLVLEEVRTFQTECEHRYRFNARWDNLLNIGGITLSVAIIAAGTYGRADISAILGGFVAALVTAQRAFPVGQRALFYRVLISQSANLVSDLTVGSAKTTEAVATLKTLRLDFAQQLPRGSTTSQSAAEQDKPR